MSLLLPIMFLIEQNLQELSGKENEGEEKEKKTHLHENIVVFLV